MRLFEILIIITALTSLINLFILKRQKLNLALSALSLLFVIANIIFEGYRVHMVPAYLLVFILLLVNVIFKPKHINKLVKALGFSLILLLLVVSIAFPLLFPVVKLPKPDGKYSVGTRYMSFKDTNRKELFSDNNGPRNIAVQVWYPSDAVKDEKAISFFPNREMSSYLAKSMQIPNVFDHISLVKTHSYLNAKLSDKENKYPIILFSGGYLSFPGQNTVLMESLASHGFIVFSISHPYEYFASQYPDGKIVSFSSTQVNNLQNELVKISKEYHGDTSGADFERYQVEKAQVSKQSIHIWSDDTKFIADEIQNLDEGKIKSIFKNKLDTSSMGVFGHSFGGATAGEVCLEDKRFKAFINMDGAPFGDSINKVIQQPFMILNGDSHKGLIEGGYSPQQKNYIDVAIKGAKHLDFTDFTLLIPSFKHLGILGSINGNTQEDIIKNYVTSFFNKYLKGTNEPLIDKGLNKYPNVTVEKR